MTALHVEPPRALTIDLLSDTTFGRGDGTAGEVDVEIEHDAYGLPFLGGKALRGLLRDSWLSMQDHFPGLWEAGHRVFGPHAGLDEVAILRLGDATLEERTRRYFVSAVERTLHPLTPDVVLRSVTEVRSQTSEDRATGAPARTTLRRTRVLVRGLRLVAPLGWLEAPERRKLRCLALAALATRHAGLARNRGRGFLQMALDGNTPETQRLAREDS
jgi:hypothetical protein